MEEGTSGSRRTRSQVAPDWSVKECLTLVNEIAAVEADCLNDLSSFQKWTMISENCNALGVHRTLNQCRRKWDSLVSDYNQIKKLESQGCGSAEKTKKLNITVNMNNELFEAINAVAMIQEDKAGTEPDADPEAEEGSDVLDVTAELAFSGSKRSRQRTMVTKDSSPLKTKKEEDPRPNRVQQKPSKAKKAMEEKKLVEEISMDEEEDVEAMEAKLSYKIDLIHAIVGRNLAKDNEKGDDISIDDKLKFVRQQGDELISCLSDIVNTFSRLREA